MSDSTVKAELVELGNSNIYVEYRNGEKFFKKEDALHYIGDPEKPHVTVESPRDGLQCAKVVFELRGERIRVFFSPPSGNPDNDLAAIRSILKLRHISF